MTARFAAAHPGKMGDALYCLPVIRHLYEQTGESFDFYTSEYCEPMRSLFEYQSCINKFIVSHEYKVERMDMGCQPADVPINGNYDHVYQLGFHRGPDRPLHQFIASEIGITIPLAVQYEYPEMANNMKRAIDHVAEGYYCIAPRGHTSFGTLFDALAQRIPCVIIGGPGDYRGYGVDLTELTFLETVTLLARAKGFIGLMSSQLVLANGFPYPKIAPWDGKSWDMSHVIWQGSNHYPINPSVDQVLNLLGDAL
jgi:hypothetical protein